MQTLGKTIFCFLLIIFFNSNLYSSSIHLKEYQIALPDSVLMNRLFSAVDSLNSLAQYRLALQTAQKAQIKFTEIKAWSEAVQSSNLMARCYDYMEDVDSSLITLNRSHKLALDNLQTGNPVFGDIFQQKGELFIQLNEQDSAKIYFNQAIQIHAAAKSYNSLAWSQLLAGLVAYYQLDFKRMEQLLSEASKTIKAHQSEDISLNETLFQFQSILFDQNGDFEQQLSVAEDALEFRLQLDELKHRDSVALSTSYALLGATYLNQGDFEKAEHFYQLAVDQQLLLNSDPIALATNYSNLGVVYQNEFSNELALEQFNKSLNILAPYHSVQARQRKYATLVNAARIHIKLENFQNAEDRLQQAAQLDQNGETDSKRHLYYLSKALIFQNKDNTKEAKFWFHRSLQESKQQFGQVNPAGKFAYLFLAEIYFKQDSLQQALLNYQAGLGIDSIHQNDFHRNPELSDIQEVSLALPILLFKSKALAKLPGQKNLIAAYESIHLAIKLIDKTRQNYETEGAKQILSTKAFDVYEQAINLAMTLYSHKKEKKYLNQAFEFSEKSKAFLLLEALQLKSDNQIATAFNLPDSLRQSEKNIKAQLVFYEGKVFEEKQKGVKGDSLKLKKWNQKLSDYRNQYEQLRLVIKASNPDYFRLKYDLQTVSVQNIQTSILNKKQKTAFIEYFIGNERLYIFVITADDFKLHHMNIDASFIERIALLQKFQNENPLTGKEADLITANYQQFTSQAFSLYTDLIGGKIPEEINQLIIVPGGILGYLSFDWLLMKPADSIQVDYSIQHLEYLIEQYQLSYTYSGTLLLESIQQKEKEAAQPYGGFAPFTNGSRQFDEDRSCMNGQLTGLPNTKNSVEKIVDLLGGNNFQGDAASRSTFIEQVGNYQLLHLSTHACIDDNNPLFNRIYFADQSLSTYELYQLELNAALVVLGACETGAGELIQGEGIMSLARGFMKSGCPSIITSLWNANDYSTSQIMIRFFELLKEGQYKDEALRNAKLDYLNEAPSRLSPPYYWATFVHIGNYSPIQNSSFPYWMVILSVVMIALTGYFSFKKRKA